MRVAAVVQARMGSTRLPGKVLRPLGGRPVLSWVLRAARESGCLDRVVVATSTLPEDDAVAGAARAEGAEVVRGDADDVLARYLLALEQHPADAVLRLTSDCPLLDPDLLRAVVALWRAAPASCDYVATTLERTLPRGLDAELVTAGALLRAGREAEGYHRAHVTSYVWSHPELFRLSGLVVRPAAADLRLTLDTPEDAALLDAVVAAIGDRAPSWRELVELMRSRPELASLNATVVQKALEEG
ncbi:spore coat protein [Blastococcus sp. MG754426]|uniref:cytidylyltransferase domain-containing protein n=1 Tax=unclassified Blastococcus TaxID=2619396 RepID=UPI001EF0FA10|nr:MULTISPECIES: glycosyltransferase family protein [unclassified Blastococcus]MCF6507969.1 spore coat protein [Blastococcus sp. MG754426]MCF6512551.1 spore coat protein [Blastococcus sp. MG754427]MCF6735320.1 spore coat protein [Blastococcus sp. KM273129]